MQYLPNHAKVFNPHIPPVWFPDLHVYRLKRSAAKAVMSTARFQTTPKKNLNISTAKPLRLMLFLKKNIFFGYCATEIQSHYWLEFFITIARKFLKEKHLAKISDH